MATRRERVVLELDDQFSAGMARAAAASELFQKSLGRTSVQSDRTGTALRKADTDTQKFSATVTRSTRDLDSYSGRLGLLASSIGAIGPAIVPITAVAIPAVTGLASQLGFAAIAGGTAMLAFNGVGDALKAVNTAGLVPTEANLEKARAALKALSPAAQDLVEKLHSMGGELKQLRTAAGSGILPGATQALDDLETRLPIVTAILHRVSMAAGEALADGAASLAGPKWDKFFHFIATEAAPELSKLARIVGNLAHGFAELWVAFGPLNSTFSSFLLQAARGFDSWASGLSKTEGFHEFVAYINENGPRVGEALSAIAGAMLQMVEAAAPIGGPILDALTAMADAISAIADSPLGPPIFTAVAALSALSLVTKAWGAVSASSAGAFVAGQGKAAGAILGTTRAMINLNAVTLRNVGTTAAFVAGNAKVAGGVRSLAGGAAMLGGLALVSSGAADKVGLTNTAMLGLVGTMLGPWGAAAGAAVGLTLDMAHANDDLEASLNAANAAANDQASSLDDLKSRRAALVAEFAKVGNAGGFKGNLGRIGSFLSGDVGDFKEAIGGLDDQIVRSQGVNRRYKDALGLTSRGYQLATTSAEDFKGAVEGLNHLLSRRSSLRDYEAALDDFTKGLKDNGRTLDINTAKGRANQANLDNIVNTTLKVAENMKGSNRIEFLKRARQDILDMGGKLIGGEAQAARLTRALDNLDKKKAKPDIEVNTQEAFAQLSVFEQKLATLTGKQRTVYINTVHQDIFGTPATGPKPPPGIAAPKHPKDGGFITGPGGPRDDAIPAMISNGEFVVNAAATARNRGLLEDINAQRFADGGYASRDADMQRYQSRASHGSSASKMTVSLGDLRVVGTLQTPWGPAQVEGIARAAARDEVNDSAALDTTHARMFRGEGVRG